jgi:urocanate hydratase
MNKEWISVKEAAAMVGYSPHYFRDVFCRTEGPLVVIRVKPCSCGRRRILVSQKSVQDLVRSETLEPGASS